MQDRGDKENWQITVKMNLKLHSYATCMEVILSFMKANQHYFDERTHMHKKRMHCILRAHENEQRCFTFMMKKKCTTTVFLRREVFENCALKEQC